MHVFIINTHVTIMEYKPKEISYDYPFSVAAIILDLVALHLYPNYYNVLKPAFVFVPDEVELIMTDTDSIIFSVSRQNSFHKCKKLPFFDFSIFQKIVFYILTKIKKPDLFLKMKFLVILIKKIIPGLSFNIMLKIKIKLRKISDRIISDFFRKIIRKGMYFIATLKAKSNYTNQMLKIVKRNYSHKVYGWK